MSAGPDIAGLYAALRRLPDRTPEQRRAYSTARDAHRVSRAMAAGRRYVVRPRRAPHEGWRTQARDAQGRWVSTSGSP